MTAISVMKEFIGRKMIDLDIPLNLETKFHHENAVPKKAVYATIYCRFID